MIILSHRGYWKGNFEKNSITSIERSFRLGFGVETDIRDYKGELVISHEIAAGGCMTAEELFEIYIRCGKSLPLALNIKSDGLQIKLKELLIKYCIKNYFVFDTSIPDGLHYLKHNVAYFTRQSEYERYPSLYDDSTGVWLDEFKEHWIGREEIQQHIDNNKKICIVSPELHKRTYEKEWNHYKEIEKELNIINLMICTDYPELAQEFFNEK
ncbi:hypothetical protein N9400_02620 [Candidatus Thioglobus sp.]|nr:hypothetical protein [Candidatus Thioglobus sp.]